MPNTTQRVPEAAVEAAAKKLCSLAGPGYENDWDQLTDDGRAIYRADAIGALQAAYPAIEADLRSRLLSDRFLEAFLYQLEMHGWELQHGSDEGSAEAARPALSAALDTLEEEKG
jgi:hypothetical protein